MDKPPVKRDTSSGLSVVFFVFGSLLNLLALVLLFVNIATLARAWLTGEPVMLGAELLAPLGSFLAGVICYFIAHSLD